MEIQVELTEQDHLDFYRSYGLKRNWIGKALIILLVDIILCSIVWASSSAVLLVFTIITIILYFFFFQLPYLSKKSRLQRSYRLDPLSPMIKVYKPFSAGIEIIEGDKNRFLRYESIQKFGKAGQYIYIILVDGRYLLLPEWSFASYSEIDQFMNVIRSGIFNVKGIAAKAPLTFKPVYLVGLICLIPLIGAFAGVVLIILGLAHYKDRVFVIMGAVGILFTVAIYGSLFYMSQNSNLFKKGFADLTQTEINDLVKSIEFYKMQNGVYPDSLQQLNIKGGSFVSIYDVMSSDMKAGSKTATYQYHKFGNKYLLFSVGADGKPNTKDDIYPNIRVADTSKVGFIGKR
jgi:hypothetical protein